MTNRSADHLVIGGGLAGSTVGIHLAAAGRQVTLLEREPSAHHKVCGEFLSREAVDYLAQLGVDPISLGAQTIRSVRLTARNQVIETKLPFTALSLSRFVLDEALIKRAADSGCTVERGAFVERVTQRDGGWRAELRGGESWTSATVFLASGKHELRGMERGQGQHGDLVGFKLHWRLAAAQTEALGDSMELSSVRWHRDVRLHRALRRDREVAAIRMPTASPITATPVVRRIAWRAFARVACGNGSPIIGAEISSPL